MKPNTFNAAGKVQERAARRSAGALLFARQGEFETEISPSPGVLASIGGKQCVSLTDARALYEPKSEQSTHLGQIKYSSPFLTAPTVAVKLARLSLLIRAGDAYDRPHFRRAVMRCATSSQRPFAKLATRLLAVACASLTVCEANVEAAEPLSTPGSLPSLGDAQLNMQELLFHITDFGINQPWDRGTKIGDPFGGSLNRVYPELNNKPGAQILVQMPEDSELDRLDQKHRADLIASTLVEKVRAARAHDTTKFEIQIVENMRWGAYALPSQQGRAATFANAVYAAVGSLIVQEKSSARGIAVDVTAGSNGTEAFTLSRPSWEPYRDQIRSVSLVDGRAFYEPTKQAIQSLGANKVFIQVSYGDMPAHDLSIANISTVQRLVNDNPGLKVVLLEPLDAQKHLFGNSAAPVTPMSSHVLSMISPDAKFLVSSVNGDGLHSIGEFTSRDLRTPLQVWTPPPFSSQSSFGSALTHFTRDTAIDGAAENLDLLPGRAGNFGENIKFGYQAWKLFADTENSLKTIGEHPNDPGSDWERASVGLNL